MAKLEYGLQLAKEYRTLLNRNGINTPLRLAHFFGQAYAESNLEVVREDLRYSYLTLLKVFKKYFNAATAAYYAYKPEAIANIVYANRMGNGNTASGDGWKYRGAWFFQITGYNNYAKLSKDTGVNYVSNPNAYLDVPNAMVTAIWYWNERNLSRFADQNDVDAVSDIINIGKQTKLVGDANGYEKRYKYTQWYLKEFKK